MTVPEIHQVQTWRFTPQQLSPRESWRLLCWCAEHGAAQFTISVMCAAGEPAPLADEFEDTFDESAVGVAERQVLARDPGARVREVRLWRFDEEAIAFLRRFLHHGVFTHTVVPEGWFEDLILYRGDELMLGILTHEQEGVLRASAQEVLELQRMGFDFEPVGG